MVRNTYIYPPEPSMRIVGDIIEYTAQHMPKFNSISISGYHMQEAGANQALELAFTLADGKEYVKTALAKGLDVDDFAGRLQLLLGDRHELLPRDRQDARGAPAVVPHHEGVRRRRSPKSLMLRTHCQTSGWIADRAGPVQQRRAHDDRGDGRGVRRHAEPAHQRASTRRSRCRPSSARGSPATRSSSSRKRPTSRSVVDPWAGSYMMETLTQEMADAAWTIIEEVEAMGGMTKAVQSRLGQAEDRGERRREAGAHRFRQGRDRRRQQVQARRAKTRSTSSRSTTTRCATARSRGCRRIRAKRDAAAVQAALDALTGCARERRGQPARRSSIEAVRARATVGEVSDALEKVVGPPPRRHAEGDRASTPRPTTAAEGWEQLKARDRRLRRGRRAAARA